MVCGFRDRRPIPWFDDELLFLYNLSTTHLLSQTEKLLGAIKMSDSSSSSTSSTKNLTSNATEKLGNIQDQLATYGAQIQDYLKNVKADVSDYKFAVEKSENGLDIDVRFKAHVTMSELDEDTTTSSRSGTTTGAV